MMTNKELLPGIDTTPSVYLVVDVGSQTVSVREIETSFSEIGSEDLSILCLDPDRAWVHLILDPISTGKETTADRLENCIHVFCSRVSATLNSGKKSIDIRLADSGRIRLTFLDD